MEYVVVQRGLSYRNASIQLKNSREEEEWREYKSSIIFKEVLFFLKESVQRGLSYNRNESTRLKNPREEEWREYKSSITFISCHRPKFSLRSIFVFFIFIFFKNIFYRNIFSILQFTVLYPYRPAGGRQGACRPAGGRQRLICK